MVKHEGRLLSGREHEVATAYVDGRNYKEIARALGIAPATVRTHLRTVYRKLGVTSRTELGQTLDPHHDDVSPAPRDEADLVAELSLALDEAVRRERTLARVLRIISQQGHSLDAVIDAVLDHALEICEAEFGILFEYHGDRQFRAMRSRNIAPAFGDWLAEQRVFAVEPETGLGRVVARLTTVNIADVRGEDLYRSGAPLRVATADLGGARSFVAIPMVWGHRLLGAFTVYRTRVHPFNDRTLELAQLFADQAAIAIQNAASDPLAEARTPPIADDPTPGPDTTDAVRPLLAVLPFRPVNESDADLRRTGRRLASSIIMELSSSPLFQVIDQASSFAPEVGGTRPVESADVLGARLVVSGSIRRLPDGGFRIAPTLHEAGRPAPRWSDLIETPEGDITLVFEILLSRLCAAIGTGVERRLIDAARSRRSHNPTAMDHFLQGLESHHAHEASGFMEARMHFEAALARDPEFGRAEAALAITFVREWFWDSTQDALLDRAERHARQAIGLAPHDAWAQTAWGVVALYKRRHADAAASFDRAQELAPHDAYVVSRAALGKLYSGDFAAAIDLFRRAIVLDPLHPDRQQGMLAHALFHAGDHDGAIKALQTIAQPLSWELAWLACCQTMQGDTPGAAATAERYRSSLRTPASRYVARSRPFLDDADRERLATAMRLAGIE